MSHRRTSYIEEQMPRVVNTHARQRQMSPNAWARAALGSALRPISKLREKSSLTHVFAPFGTLKGLQCPKLIQSACPRHERAGWVSPKQFDMILEAKPVFLTKSSRNNLGGSTMRLKMV